MNQSRRKVGFKMTDDFFWKAFEATGSPELYLMYRKNKKRNSADNERDKRNADL